MKPLDAASAIVDLAFYPTMGIALPALLRFGTWPAQIVALGLVFIFILKVRYFMEVVALVARHPRFPVLDFEDADEIASAAMGDGDDVVILAAMVPAILVGAIVFMLVTGDSLYWPGAWLTAHTLGTFVLWCMED